MKFSECLKFNFFSSNFEGLANNKTKLALALYGGSMICAFLTVPLVKKKKYNCVSVDF